jgi:hypothetical protein
LKGICDSRNKKGGREAAAVRENPHLYPENRVPNVKLEVKEFLGGFLGLHF